MKQLAPSHTEDLPPPIQGDALGGSSAVTSVCGRTGLSKEQASKAAGALPLLRKGIFPRGNTDNIKQQVPTAN